MTDSADGPLWVSEYDYFQRRVSVTSTGQASGASHWTGIVKDNRLSDPDGDFDVFVAYDATDDSDHDPDGALPVVKIVARLDKTGNLANPHPDFDASVVGSMTIWPYKAAGERFALSHWMWWSEGPLFRGGPPRPWDEATSDSLFD